VKKLENTQKFEFVIIFSALIIAAALLFLYSYWGLTTTVTEIDSEVINGILTVSGIIFGFQFAFFKAPKGKTRIVWIALLLIEVIALGLVGAKYVNDALYGSLTTNTLLTVFLGFVFILFSTVMFAAFDYYYSQ